MKKIYLTLLSAMISIGAYAQKAKMDVIQKTNGEEMTGKLVSVGDNAVTFVYHGETASYTIKKADIAKIIHASGRVETFSGASNMTQTRQRDEIAMGATSSSHHNKIAILPFTYLIENQPGADQIGSKAQEDAYSFLAQHSAGYTILDPRTTNSLLAKAGATRESLMNMTMKEIGEILGVEYIVDGTVTQNKAAQTSYSSGGSNTKVKRDGDKDVKGVSTYGSSSSRSQQNYDVAVSLHIYMDNNASIYNQSHKAFFSNTSGAYKSPLEYLLKRCPLYRK